MNDDDVPDPFFEFSEQVRGEPRSYELWYRFPSGFRVLWAGLDRRGLLRAVKRFQRDGVPNESSLPRAGG